MGSSSLSSRFGSWNHQFCSLGDMPVSGGHDEMCDEHFFCGSFRLSFCVWHNVDVYGSRIFYMFDIICECDSASS